MSPTERLGRHTIPTSLAHGHLSALVRLAMGMSGLLVLSTIYFLVCLLLMPWRMVRIRLGNFAGATAGRWIYFVCGLSYEVFGPEIASRAPAIFVQNHTGTLDLFLSMQLCPAPGSGVMKREILRVPFFGFGYALSGHLLIDRGNIDSAIRSMRSTADMVRSNHLSIWILPEGTRSADGRQQSFKKGFAHLAIQTGLPIVPIVVHEGHRFWQHGMTVHPGTICVEVMPPVKTTNWAAETIEEHVRSIEDVFTATLAAQPEPERA